VILGAFLRFLLFVVGIRAGQLVRDCFYGRIVADSVGKLLQLLALFRVGSQESCQPGRTARRNMRLQSPGHAY
jgi:hypothetical protein